MKVNILYRTTNLPGGGANQFLGALKKQFNNRNIYTDNVKESDIVLFNSHSLDIAGSLNFFKVVWLKFKCPEKLLVHRISGPLDKYRGTRSGIDRLIYLINYYVADATVFQSKWSRKENYAEGMKENRFEAIISNIADPSIFNNIGRQPFSLDRKTRLVAVSWSSNMNKGFETYKFLDDNLDFTKYEMILIGNCPVEFKNINKVGVLSSAEIAVELKKQDIFINTSTRESMSNANIESLQCGLPVILFGGSSNIEIDGFVGEFFTDNLSLLEAIGVIRENYDKYHNKDVLNRVEKITEEYVDYFQKLLAYYMANNRKTLTTGRLVNIYIIVIFWILKNKIRLWIS